MMKSRSLAIAALLLAGIACGKSKETEAVVRPAPVTPTANPTPPPESKGSADEEGTKDKLKGDKKDDDWGGDAENRAGMSRWKDTGVYVDGKPIGFLSWGELPLGLKPTWIKDKVSDRKRPGTNDPGWKWAQQRMYKFTDYFKAVGIDIRKIKEVHVYGPKLSQTLIVSRKDLLGPHINKFMFRYGSNVGGKVIAVADSDIGNGKVGDKLSGVMIYIDKKPPTLIRNEGLELDGVMQTGVPYYGEPIRGGIRIYLDDKLVAIIKRQELDPKKATKSADGTLAYKLSDVFTAQGVDTSKVVEAYVIRDDKRREKFPGADLATLSFAAIEKAHGGVQLVEKKITANALALHTREIKPSELPTITEWDD